MFLHHRSEWKGVLPCVSYGANKLQSNINYLSQKGEGRIMVPVWVSQVISRSRISPLRPTSRRNHPQRYPMFKHLLFWRKIGLYPRFIWKRKKLRGIDNKISSQFSKKPSRITEDSKVGRFSPFLFRSKRLGRLSPWNGITRSLLSLRKYRSEENCAFYSSHFIAVSLSGFDKGND